jgi:hypothetical protein
VPECIAISVDVMSVEMKRRNEAEILKQERLEAKVGRVWDFLRPRDVPVSVPPVRPPSRMAKNRNRTPSPGKRVLSTIFEDRAK